MLVMPLINTLPFDVFQIIVTTCWEDEGEVFAIAASHVCRVWRRYVLDMPLLWNELKFAEDARWDMLEAKLKRSRQAPLDIVIEEEVFLKSGMPHLRKVMEMIVPHITRWRSLRMVEVPHKIRRVLLDQLRSKSAPLLERVEVVQGAKYDRSWGRRIKSTSRHWDARKILDGIPNLRHVEWANPEAQYRFFPCFQNLLTLKIGRGTLEIAPEQFVQLVLRLLPASPALQALSLYHGPDSTYEPEPYDGDVKHLVQSPTVHWSLQKLRIASTTSIRGVILRSLILPNLRSLGEPYDDAEVNISCCKALAQNALPKIRGLVIAGNSDDSYGCDPAFYPHMPSLRSAIINLQCLVVLTFRFVDFGGGNKWLPDLGNCCPKLKSLMLLVCTGYTVKAIRKIVEMRMKREDVESLEELRIAPSWGERDFAASDKEAAWFSQVLRFNSLNRDWDNLDEYDL